jgi:hypothetical protein
MSYALAYLGTLAFVAFVLWMRGLAADRMSHDIAEGLRDEMGESVERRVAALREVSAGWDDRLKALESTVSTLAVGAGLKMRSPVEPKA